MRIRVLYFAAIKELLGRGEELVEVSQESADVARVAARLVEVHPELEVRLGSVRFAVNEAFAAATTPVNDGDVLAVIPPVSGG